MPVFHYKAYNNFGKEVTGDLEALTAGEAARRLKRDGLFPREISSSAKEKRVFRVLRRGVSPGELAVVSSQLSTLLASGATLYESLSILINEVESRSLKDVLIDIKDRISGGSSLGRALEAHPDVFPEMYSRMVEAGEASGTLDKVMTRLAEYLEAKAGVNEQVRTALVYPILMSLVGIGVLGFLLLFVIPKITRIFEDTEEALPLITVVLLWVVGFFRTYWPVVIVALAGGGWALRDFVRRPGGRAVKDRFLIRLPWMGRLINKFYVANLARTLGSLLESGVPVIKAMEMTKRVLGHAVYDHVLDKAIVDVTEGGSISRSLGGFPVVPGLLVHMTAIGERSGNLDKLLLRAAGVYEKEFETSVKRALSMLEPVLILVMGVVVGFIVLAILLPIFQLNQVIR
ncbi:MAG TPA: type II secretion system inner membrane protein GspF [Thermodesulfobacteriota bacterium]|nr:type II secretion system inner membrane protein GspF [Thermodesulfobacteriota bacterium]